MKTSRATYPQRTALEGPRWVPICEAHEPNDDLGVRVEIGDGLVVAAFRVGEEYFVIDDTCTHGSASLSEGFVDGNQIECPFHGGKFDMRTGKPTAFPCTVPLKVYVTRVEGGKLFARIS